MAKKGDFSEEPPPTFHLGPEKAVAVSSSGCWLARWHYANRGGIPPNRAHTVLPLWPGILTI